MRKIIIIVFIVAFLFASCLISAYLIIDIRKFPEMSDPKRITLKCNYRNQKVTLEETLFKSVDEYYASEPQKGNYTSGHKYASFIFNYKEDKIIKNLTQKISTKGKKMGLSEDETMDLATCFVQNIPYDKEKGKIILSMNEGNNIDESERETIVERFPYETLYDNSGTCTDKSYLEAAILEEMDYGVSLLVFDKEMHMAVGVKTPKGYTSFSTGYSYLETTSVGFKVGQLPILDKDIGGARNLEMEEVGEARPSKPEDLLQEILDSKFSPPSEIFKVSDGKQYMRVIEITKTLNEIKEIIPEINNKKKELISQKKVLNEKQNETRTEKNKVDDYEKKAQLAKNKYLASPTSTNYSIYMQAYSEYKTSFNKAKSKIDDYNSNLDYYNSEVGSINRLINEYNALIKETNS